MKLSIVTNGEEYAIERRQWCGTDYVDLHNHGFFWGKEHFCFRDCVTTDKERIIRIFSRLTRKFVPVSCADICADIATNKKKGAPDGGV